MNNPKQMFVFHLALFLIAPAMILFSCTSNRPQTMEKKVTIVGTAQNSKAGAVVITADSSVYFVDGMPSWDDEVLNGSVKVSGELVVVNHPAEDLVNEKGEYSQGMSGEQKIIKKAIVQKK